MALSVPLVLSSCAMMIEPSPSARADLAPTGKLRVGLNYGNFLLVTKDAASGASRGVAVDLATELARRLDVPFEIVAYETAGKMADAVKSGAWDVAFLGAEPARANEIAFTSAYLEIESSYLVPAQSPIRTIADVDRPGVRIAVAEKSAYDLYLARSIKHATLVRAAGIDASYKLFIEQKLDALAGLRPRLVMDAEKLPGSRILEGRFTAVQQSIGTPRAREAGALYLRAFVEEAKASGRVARAIESNGVRGVSVAPAAAA
jgi:polar amino acid transport system substrate-binding protein